MGEQRGFKDARGTLFFRIAEIIKDKIDRGYKPTAVILENVKALRTHDQGRTFATIKRILEEDLGYKVYDDILNSAEHGVPQTRNRTYIVCFANETGGYKAKSEIDLKIARPLCATMAKMHRACQDNYVTQNGRIRRLTPRECARLQGFSDTFKIPVSDTQAYKQFGNAVTVNVSRAVAESVRESLQNLGEWND